MLKKIKIDSFKGFNDFQLNFSGTSWLNLLVGRNGSGKSTFLDALAEIGVSNLISAVDHKVDNVRFNYTIETNNVKISKNKERPENYSGIWNNIIRLHTGYTERTYNENIQNYISCDAKTSKIALFVFLALGFHKTDKGWKQLINLVFNNSFKCADNVFSVKSMYIDTPLTPSSIEDIENNEATKDEIVTSEDFAASFLKNFFITMPNYKISQTHYKNENTRFFWQNNNNSILKELKEKSCFVIFEDFYKEFPHPLKDVGFFYTVNDNQIVFDEQFLSDGEHGILSRYALLYLLSKNDKKSLILLDEPETHFNEHWKRYFLYIVSELFKNKQHDVFIATHSAMLVTDAKNNELYKFENNDGEIRASDTLINSYGVNTVDIGQILFKMEGSIGERAKEDIESVLSKGSTKDIEELLKEVGPGEYRWRLRARLKYLEDKEQEPKKKYIRSNKRC
ncbi:MAG: AAA family ATPase [Alphaproteobacteria bacterium]